MRIRALAIVLLFMASAAFAQMGQPAISKVNPPSGTAAGGTLVTITGSGLFFCPPYMASCIAPVVFFGGRQAAVVEYASERVVVQTPSSSPGACDVVVTNNGGTATLSHGFTFGSTAFERVLLPVFISGEAQGGYGSRWATEIRGFNAGISALRITDHPEIPCQQESACGGYVTSRAFFSPILETERPGTGRFVYVTSGKVGSASLNLRVRDVSRESDTMGTELAVVTAADTFGADSIIPLVNVPFTANYRQKLRIYDFDGEFRRTVRVKVSDGDFAHPLITRDVILSSGPTSIDFPGYPGYAEFDLNTLPELAGHDRVTVTVETPSEGRFWAYVSVTNNVTQQVTHVTP